MSNATPLQLSKRITLLPVVHGSGDFAVEVRRLMLSQKFDCLAVPLPSSFQEQVEAAIPQLPIVQAVWQKEQAPFDISQWTPEQSEEDEDDVESASYVPIDPCQPVITAIRIALQEHIPRRFVDLEVQDFNPSYDLLPHPYAVKKLTSDLFAVGTIPLLEPTQNEQVHQRCRFMAARLRELEIEFESVLMLCSMTEWLLIKQAYDQQLPQEASEEVLLGDVESAPVDPATLIFFLGQLPFVTGLYEQARYELDDDENLSVEGLKQLMLATRTRYQESQKKLARPITPKLLSTYFHYVRNLSLVERRLVPDLYTLITAAQQIFGDQFAIELAELVREYPFAPAEGDSKLAMGIDQARLPDGDQVEMKSRLPGHPVSWRTCQLQRRPPKIDQQKWKTSWNPYSQCSWPPEDVAIENFRSHVKDQALALLGHDLAKTEKFSSSLKDGLDIRETLRNWHTGDLYVKEIPPTRGGLDCVIMLFDSPADPRDYPWRITWHAEHHDESTLAFFSSDYHEEMVGPGIALGRYGGAMFLFPPRNVPDIWNNPRFDGVDTLEERLIMAGSYYSQEKHIAILSEAPPGVAWKKLAGKFRKKLIHVPLKKFSQQTIQQLRMFHVLNGKEVRSFASHFIRKS